MNEELGSLKIFNFLGAECLHFTDKIKFLILFRLYMLSNFSLTFYLSFVLILVTSDPSNIFMYRRFLYLIKDSIANEKDCFIRNLIKKECYISVKDKNYEHYLKGCII